MSQRKKQNPAGLKLRVANSGGEEIKTRDAGDRAARRARRAQMMKEMSTDEGSKTATTAAVAPRTSVVIEKPADEPKEERKTSAGSSFRVNGSVGLKVNGLNSTETEKPNQTGSALRRTATWSHNKDRTAASNTIGKALNKFGSQVSLLRFIGIA